jgi:2-polyprenyl-6-methoxyphenol hydroxylase-like FAD-dependent oxidoreductase
LLVALERADGTQESVEAEWVIGAGGAHSVTRASMAEALEGETYPGAALVADVRVRCRLPRDGGALVATPVGVRAPRRRSARPRTLGPHSRAGTRRRRVGAHGRPRGSADPRSDDVAGACALDDRRLLRRQPSRGRAPRAPGGAAGRSRAGRPLSGSRHARRRRASPVALRRRRRGGRSAPAPPVARARRRGPRDGQPPARRPVDGRRGPGPARRAHRLWATGGAPR